MNSLTFAAETIKERVSMQDAIAQYTPNPGPRGSRIPCPVHGGKNYNLSFTDSLFHCFVCGSSGDVIHFVQHVFDLDFRAALEKLNSDFGLGIPLRRRATLRERTDAQRHHERIVAERERREAEQKAYDDLYWSLWSEWIRLDRNLIQHAPQSPDDEPHPLFVEALQKIDHQEYLIDSMKAW